MGNQAGKRRRGIYLLPNLLTTGCLFFGFFAVVAAVRGDFAAAAIAVYVAMVFDGLDGRVARLTNTQSDFGVQYDSLADMVSFGLAPAIVAYQWALADLDQLGGVWGGLGWVGGFAFAACAALRLARFNTQVGVADKRYFQGLPSPAAAGAVAGLVWVGDGLGFASVPAGITALVLLLVAGALMVSNVRYHSFKEVDFLYRVRFIAIVALLLGVVLIAIHPPAVLFVGFLAYLLSGPVVTVGHLRRRRLSRRAGE